MKIINKGIFFWRRQPLNESEPVLISLLKYKAEVFKRQRKYVDAVNTLEELLTFDQKPQQAIKVLSKIAICYDSLGDIDNSCLYLKKILELNPKELSTVNNLANLLIRKGSTR